MIRSLPADRFKLNARREARQLPVYELIVALGGPGRQVEVPVDRTRPSIFTALEEQLGLKLQPATGPVDVVVIDHGERPTPDR
jgi:Protein of unknown function (DUF3738)